MPSGLVALLDDIAGITKLAAASLDDTPVTPRYVMGLSPERELPRA
jgi:predicted DNA repair protein MutK